MKGGCDGAGFACPQLDSLRLTVATGDAVTPTERLRYVAAFGSTAAEAASADYELLFSADSDSATTISAYLGFEGARDGAEFRRARLCVAIAAVDEAANVGARSEPICVDTTDTRAATTTVVQGTPCWGGGCGAGPGGLELVLALLVLGWLTRR